MVRIKDEDNYIKATLINDKKEIKSNAQTVPSATTKKKGIIRIATDEEAIEGISEDTAITPHTLKNATENKIDEVIGDDLIDVERNGNSITITSKTFIYEQGLASDTWVIVHNLNKRPTVSAVDTAGNLQIPDDVNYDNDNQITVKFIGAFAGYAYLN